METLLERTVTWTLLQKWMTVTTRNMTTLRTVGAGFAGERQRGRGGAVRGRGRGRGGRQRAIDQDWREELPADPLPVFAGHVGLREQLPAEVLMSPLLVFEKFITPAMLHQACTQTNLYYYQCQAQVPTVLMLSNLLGATKLVV